MPETSDIHCIACSVFREELKALQERGLLDLNIRFLDSDLHLKPSELRERMVPILESDLEQGHGVLLAYGDCHPHMAELMERRGVARTCGVNCSEILLGRELYRRLIKEGAFFLFPEWTLRWRDIFSMLLRLDLESTAEVIRDMHSKLVYLDTGVVPVPKEKLKACADYCCLPFEVLHISLDNLLGAINEALERLADERRTS